MKQLSIAIIIAALALACGGGDSASSSRLTRGGEPSATTPGAMQQPSGSSAAGSGAPGDFGNANGGPIVPRMPTVGHPGGACNQDVDVVFVLDVSGSMIPPLSTLEREVDMVDAALNAKGLPSHQHYGLVVFVDQAQVMNGGMPYLDVEAVKTELRSQIQMTNDNPSRQLDGTPDNVTWPENSLDALYAAATQFQWRPGGDTLRTVILITDASFWDLMAPSSGADSEQNGIFPDQVSMHGYDETIGALRQQMIWVNTFAAKTGGPPDGMTSPPSHGNFRGTSVDVGIGFFEPYMGKPSIPEATGGFAWDIDEVYDGKISLATPINQSIEVHECAQYPL
jgi:hypothetical protein